LGGRQRARACGYNCSDQIIFPEVVNLFKGLSSSEAWDCFDEFNRIDNQMLSVMAKQVLTFEHANQQNKTDCSPPSPGTSLRPSRPEVSNRLSCHTLISNRL
jgi:hypothetical protein